MLKKRLQKMEMIARRFDEHSAKLISLIIYQLTLAFFLGISFYNCLFAFFMLMSRYSVNELFVFALI